MWMNSWALPLNTTPRNTFETRCLCLLPGLHLFSGARHMRSHSQQCQLLWEVPPHHPSPEKLLTGSLVGAKVGCYTQKGWEEVLTHAQAQRTSLVAGGRTYLQLSFPWWGSCKDICLRGGMQGFFHHGTHAAPEAPRNHCKARRF